MAECERVMIMAGGTGGHVFPALAVAAELASRGIAVNWLGTRHGIEAELVPQRGYPIHFLTIEGIRGTGLVRWLKAPFLMVAAIFQAMRIMRLFKPDAVLGLGGFASGPGGIAAWMMRTPLVIHEQNAVAGTTNKLLARFAARILAAFPGVLPNSEWCGNPVRAEIAALPDPATRIAQPGRRLRLLVLGGSQGALAINELVPQAVVQLNEDSRPDIRHQCGRLHEEKTHEAYRNSGVTAEIVPFIADMAEAYGWADYVVCRSGALTVSELAAAGVGSLLIPYPHAIDDHQTGNALWLAESGAAEIIQQSEITAEWLAQHLQQVLSNPYLLMQQARLARTLAKSSAAQTVANVCEEVCGG